MPVGVLIAGLPGREEDVLGLMKQVAAKARFKAPANFD